MNKFIFCVPRTVLFFFFLHKYNLLPSKLLQQGLILPDIFHEKYTRIINPVLAPPAPTTSLFTLKAPLN